MSICCSNGRAVHYNGSSLLQWRSVRLDVSLSVGDVAGVGWERQGDSPLMPRQQVKGLVYFTHKGRRLPSVIDDVAGGMWPVLHIQKKVGVIVSHSTPQACHAQGPKIALCAVYLVTGHFEWLDLNFGTGCPLLPSAAEVYWCSERH